ncbi:protein phosphatase 1 regulatory subunit 17 [Spea bombifrons]|uniref:protein phosphatase 1 regulatory subunit 17 n=1 Tax=Spea bombifrons TaxID=233779 RepID=UPI0023494DBA|nr:protein phosphatase 1 regulatory subunit 17 [Spea bombifrons]
MSTEHVSPLDITEDRLDKGEQLLDNLSEQLIRSCDIQIKARQKTPQVSQSKEVAQKHPRRKDTPALHTPPILQDFSDKLMKTRDAIKRQQTSKTIHPVYNNEQVLMKPKRKDTPALYISPLLPGAKLLKDEQRIVIQEDEEKDG